MLHKYHIHATHVKGRKVELTKHLDIHGPSSDEAVLGTAFAAAESISSLFSVVMRLCCNVPEVDTAAAVEHSPAAAGEDSLAGIGPVEEGNSLGEVVGGTYIHKTQIRYHFQAQKKKKKNPGIT